MYKFLITGIVLTNLTGCSLLPTEEVDEKTARMQAPDQPFAESSDRYETDELWPDLTDEEIENLRN